MQICDVGNNNLTGGVSLLLSNTPFLFIFHVDGNSLDGPIPDVFASFSINVSTLVVRQQCRPHALICSCEDNQVVDHFVPHD